MFPSFFGIWAGAVGLGILAAWVAGLTWYLIRAVRHYQRLVSGTDGSNLQKVVDRLFGKQYELEQQLKHTEEAIQTMRHDGRRHIQHIGFMRFNPFEETGGDQSFVAAFLDKNKDGLVISSLHTRAGTRVYAKAIQGGKGVKHSLSHEEEEAIAHSVVFKEGRVTHA